MSAAQPTPESPDSTARHSLRAAPGLEFPVWRSLVTVTDRPETKRKILCAYSSPGGDFGDWQWGVSIYDPELHRIFINGEPWHGNMIKRKNVQWTELPAPPPNAAPEPRGK